MGIAPDQLLGQLLRDVSRSFYVTLRVLPASIRDQIGLAYLLARTTDTVADTGLVPLDQRLRALQILRERIQGTGPLRADFGELAQHQGSPAERVLLENCETSITLLRQFSPPDQQLIRDVLHTITSGQELDLLRFARASPSNTVSLASDQELDDYTYRVAGCVGEFWTKICRAHLFPKARLDETELLKNAIRFGKGLQLVNILRDLPADLRKGRCYLPADKLAAAGLAPADLLKPACRPSLRPLYNAYLDRTASYLAQGWLYTNSLPWAQVRVRLACAWPILIGFKTVCRMRETDPFDALEPVKISRSEVRRAIAWSLLLYPVPPLWRTLCPLPALNGG